MNLYPREPEYILDSQSEKTIHSSAQLKDMVSILEILEAKQEHLSGAVNMSIIYSEDIHTLLVELSALVRD